MPEPMKSILIADDNRQIRMLVSVALRSLGHEILEAEDGEAALDIAVASRPALILLDIVMPKLDGFEVLHFLRQRPETHDCAVVILTAESAPADVVRAIDGGADDYLVKPFEPHMLRELVVRLLG